jgi:tetratricopeptide (TPR) repeat protein
MHKPKVIRIAWIAFLFALTGSMAVAQTADEEAIKKTVRAETEAYYGANAEGWEAKWVHDSNTTRTIVANNSYYTTTGWSSFGPETVKGLKASKPNPMELKSDNYVIRADGNLAWVEYDQYMNTPGGDPKNRRFSREHRVLLRENGEWKIASQITHDPETFDASSKNVESALNGVGYRLVQTNKLKDAIEVLRVNAKLNPNSANCYDSLGEVYALDGNKREAIKNYEKAIALDPTFESSKAALAKLRK